MKYLGAVLLVLSGYVMAEEVYYCSDNTNGATGFWKNEKTGQYERSGFNESKFKMKLQDDGNIAIENSDMESGKDYIYVQRHIHFCQNTKTKSHVCLNTITATTSTSTQITADIFCSLVLVMFLKLNMAILL